MKNKKFGIRITAVFAAVLLVMTALPYGVFAASSDMTKPLFEERLASFRENVYANGSTYVDNVPEYRGSQCFGFANQISKYVFGSFPTAYGSGKKLYSNNWEINRGSEALASLHIGDVVRYRSSAAADHSIFITGMDDRYVYFSDANNDHRNTVRHNAQMTWEKLTDRIDRALESDSNYIGFVAHYKYWDDEPEQIPDDTVSVSYNANGARIDCVRTGDVYSVVTAEGLIIRDAPGTQANKITTMRYGSIFHAPDGYERPEVGGYTWAKVVFGEYEGWSAVSDPDFCRVKCPLYDTDLFVDPETSLIRTSSDGELLIRTLENGAAPDDPASMGLHFEDNDVVGWSFSPDGDPVSTEELFSSYSGKSVVLYAVKEKDPPEEQGSDTGADPDPERLTVSYNANGGYTESGRLGDIYKVTAYDGLIIREGPGTENKKIVTMKADSLFDVYDSTAKVEKGGFTWAKVKFGEYTGWSAVSDFCSIVEQINGGVYCLGGNGSDIYVTSTGERLEQIIDGDSSLLDHDDLGLKFPYMKFKGWSETPDGAPVTIGALREAHGSGNVTLYALWEAVPQEDEPLKGDVNGDGALNNRDVVVLFRYLSGEAYEGFDVSAADVNGDGTVNNKDITTLFRIVSE